MKKLILLLTLLFSTTASAQVATTTTLPLVACAAECQAPFSFLQAGVVGFAAFVIYANAEGIPFPLCGVGGLECYGDYPHDKNGE